MHYSVNNQDMYIWNRIRQLIAFSLFLFVAFTLIIASRDQEMTSYEGYGDPAPSSQEVKELAFISLQRLKTGHQVHLSERDLNKYLNHVLEMKQSRAIRAYIELTGIYIDLAPNQFTLCLRRSILGHPHSCSMSFTSDPSSSEMLIPRSCLIGKLKLPPEFGMLLMPWIRSLSESLVEIFDKYSPYCRSLDIHEGVLILTPTTL